MSPEKNSFLQLLEHEFSNLTPTGKRIASYLLGNPQQLPFESADSIAQQASTSGISVGRFLRSLGYQNLDEVKQSLRGDAPGSWLITDRIGAFRAENTNDDALERSMHREVEAIQQVYSLARSDAFACFLEIPVESPPNFSLSRRVQTNGNHFSRARSSARTCSAGTVSTSPASSCATRRAISSSQAAAMASGVSTLTQSFSARSARSSGVSCMAAWATCW